MEYKQYKENMEKNIENMEKNKEYNTSSYSNITFSHYKT